MQAGVGASRGKGGKRMGYVPAWCAANEVGAPEAEAAKGSVCGEVSGRDRTPCRAGCCVGGRTPHWHAGHNSAAGRDRHTGRKGWWWVVAGVGRVGAWWDDVVQGGLTGEGGWEGGRGEGGAGWRGVVGRGHGTATETERHTRRVAGAQCWPASAKLFKNGGGGCQKGVPPPSGGRGKRSRVCSVWFSSQGM